MFISSSVFFVLLRHFRKALMLLWLLGPLACKDFKNWESIYPSKVKITFEQKKDKWNAEVLEDLESAKLEDLRFIKWPITRNQNEPFCLNDNNYNLSIPLDPNADAVSFEVASQDNNNNDIYYNKVTIHYERNFSLISHQAGGLQIKYTIKAIHFSPKNNKRPIFKGHRISHSTRSKEDQKNSMHHVTLYY